ncbi:MAG: hypothetical protein GY722_06670 [bacterium]|nr:hypothetical protein [bacterium]
MTATSGATILTELRRQKVRVQLNGASIRVSAPKGVVSDEHRVFLKARKPELIERLRFESALLDMTIEEFSRQRYSIELHVDWLDETIWIVPTVSAARQLVRGGINRGRVWTAKELLDLLRIDDLQSTEARRIARLKATFGLEILSVSGCDEVSP